MSDGYRTVAALVVDILKQVHGAYGELVLDTTDGTPNVPSPGVVIIDEIDARRPSARVLAEAHRRPAERALPEHPDSDQAGQKREEILALEPDVVRGRAGEEAKAQYRHLKRKLASSLATRVDEIAARLHSSRPRHDS